MSLASHSHMARYNQNHHFSRALVYSDQISRESFSYLWLLSLLEESLLAGLLLGLLADKVLGLGNLIDLLGVDTGEVDLLGCSDDVSGVDSSQGDAVDLEGAGDEQNTLVEGLQKDDTLAAETAGEQDQDRAGLQRLARLPSANGLADLCAKVMLAVLSTSTIVHSFQHPVRSAPRDLHKLSLFLVHRIDSV